VPHVTKPTRGIPRMALFPRIITSMHQSEARSYV
jgi:hypothetical protein